MATLPKAVQAQVDAAEALLASSTTPQAEPENTPVEQAAETSSEQVQVEQPQPVQVSSDTKPQQDVWEARYKSLQGLFNQQVPELQRQVKDLNHRYQQAIESLEKVGKATEANQSASKPAVDPKDVDAFGADLVEMVQRVAQQMLGNTAAKIDGFMGSVEKRLVQLEQRLQGTTETVAQTAQETFYVQLERMVPDWQAINADQRFLVWLGEDDPLSGRSRQAALDAASGALDVRRTAAIFKAFLDTLPKQPPKANTAVNKQVSPSSVAAAAPVQTEAPSFTEAEVAELYARNRRREFTPKQWEQVEQSINTAMAMGRIRPR